MRVGLFTYFSFLTVVNGQSIEAQPINAGIPQCSLLGPTLFLLYIDDLSNSIHRSFVNIYTGNTTGCRHTSKPLDDQSLDADILSHPVLIVEGEEELDSHIQCLETKRVCSIITKQTPNLSLSMNLCSLN